jgi:hypothetical protein
MHDVASVVTRDALRAACIFYGVERKNQEAWKRRIDALLLHRPQADLLVSAGVTVELLAFCQITLDELVKTNGYRLETLVECFQMTFADLCLLGFTLASLRDTQHYPLIALYDKASVRADDLFALDISFNTFKKCVIDVDWRYATLLDINVDYWQRILGGVGRK